MKLEKLEIKGTTPTLVNEVASGMASIQIEDPEGNKRHQGHSQVG